MIEISPGGFINKYKLDTNNMPDMGPGKYLSNEAILNRQSHSFSKDRRGKSVSALQTPDPYHNEISTMNSKYRSSSKLGKFG